MITALADAQAQATPWWAVPLLSGVFAFVGVAFAQVVVLYTDRRRSTREDQTRWHNDRRVLYSQFSRQLRDLGEMITSDHEAQVPADETFTKIDLQLSASYEELTFLAGRPVINAASSAVRALEVLANDGPAENDVSADFTRARFIGAAREELGITKPERRYSISSDSLRDVLKWAAREVATSVFDSIPVVGSLLSR
jgi:hypothetical protein